MSYKYEFVDDKGDMNVSVEFLTPFIKKCLCKSTVLHCVDYF